MNDITTGGQGEFTNSMCDTVFNSARSFDVQVAEHARIQRVIAKARLSLQNPIDSGFVVDHCIQRVLKTCDRCGLRCRGISSRMEEEPTIGRAESFARRYVHDYRDRGDFA